MLLLSKNGSGRALAKYDSFAVSGPKLWNVLLADVSVMDNPWVFDRVHTEWCSKLPDRPPVAGYRRLDKSDVGILVVYLGCGPELDEPAALWRKLSLLEGRKILRPTVVEYLQRQ